MKPIFNPYLPSYEYIPDGEPHIFNNRLYIYGSHDRFNGTTYCENDYVCWSAPVDNLSDWRFEGEIYNRRQHPHKEERMLLFAPDVVQGIDKRYYLYYSIAHSSRMSVAVCDSPAGRFEYLGDVKTKDGRVYGISPGDYVQFDPGVFIDDDNSVYLYSGFIHSASDIGLRGYTIENTAYPNGNTHGSIIDINGQYYIFDHRFTNNSSYCRQGVAEKINIEKNGYIHQAEATSCGLNNTALDACGTYPAYITCHVRNLSLTPDITKEDKLLLMPYVTQDGDDREAGDDQYIKNIQNGCIIGYKYFDFDKQQSKKILIKINIKGTAKGYISITTDMDYADKEFKDYNKNASTYIDISDTLHNNNSDNWKTIELHLSNPAGIKPLYFMFEGTGAFSIKDFTFIPD